MVDHECTQVVRVPLVDSLREHEWTHLAVVLTRPALGLKPSTLQVDHTWGYCRWENLQVYLNGRCIASQKMHYILQVGLGRSRSRG